MKKKEKRKKDNEKRVIVEKQQPMDNKWKESGRKTGSQETYIIHKYAYINIHQNTDTKNIV